MKNKPTNFANYNYKQGDKNAKEEVIKMDRKRRLVS